MRDEEPVVENLSGSLLLASPSLIDPNFQKAVILLSVHSQEDGALGVIINRPAGKTLGDLDKHFATSDLANVPVYEGGPVYADQMILSAWKCSPENGVFKLYFGISEEKALEIKSEDPGADIRGFLGYAGWSGGQLEQELELDSWVVCPVDAEALSTTDGTAMWRHILGQSDPVSGMLPEMPDDPSLN